MPDRDARERRRRAAAPGLFWAGVGLAPVAALLLLVGGNGTLARGSRCCCDRGRVVLVGASITLRDDPATVRVALEDQLAEEVEALRADVRRDIAQPPRRRQHTVRSARSCRQLQRRTLRGTARLQPWTTMRAGGCPVAATTGSEAARPAPARSAAVGYAAAIRRRVRRRSAAADRGIRPVAARRSAGVRRRRRGQRAVRRRRTPAAWLRGRTEAVPGCTRTARPFRRSRGARRVAAGAARVRRSASGRRLRWPRRRRYRPAEPRQALG